MSASGSISSSETASFTLWIERFTGPNSTTSGQISTMKRPSEVPPVVETSGRHAGHLLHRARERRPRGARAA